MNDKTEELLPISMLNKILFDEKVFLDFLERKGIFEDVKVKNNLKELNDYMKLLIRTSGAIDDEIYNRINAINIKFGNKDVLYKKDIYATGKIVTINAIERILYDEEVFSKFLNYEEEKEYFSDGTLLNYLIEIVDYYNYIDKNNMVLEYEVIKRYHAIMKKYSLDLKRYYQINGYMPQGIINSKLEREILDSIDGEQNKFNIAYKVYRELNKRCRYSPTHVALRTMGNKEKAMFIYNVDIETIDDKNNEVTCNSWANIYTYLLRKLGFNARVCGGYHKYVEFSCDGTLMRADATEVSSKSRDGFYLNDITRCQLGLQVENFICLEEEKELDDIIDCAYHDSSDYSSEYLDELKGIERCYKEEYMRNSNRTPFNMKIMLIKKKCLECGLVDAEMAKYIDLLMRLSFSYQELSDMEVNYVAIRETDNKYQMSVIFHFGEYYNIFDKDIGLIIKDTEEIVKMFGDGDLVLLGKNARCRILDSDGENAYARVG